MKLTVISDDTDPVAFSRAAAGDRLDGLFDAQDATDDAPAGRSDLDAGAAQRLEELDSGRRRIRREAQRAETTIERIFRVVAHAEHSPAVQIQRRQRRQDVVQLAAG